MRGTFFGGLVLLLAGSLVGGARADTHACTTVDKSAKAFVSSSASATITEQDRNCTISINGATSMGVQSALWAQAANTVLEAARRDEPVQLTPEMVYGLFQAPIRGDDQNTMNAFVGNMPADELVNLIDCFSAFTFLVKQKPEADFRTDALDKPLDDRTVGRVSCGSVDAGHTASADDKLMSMGSTGLAAVLRDGDLTSQFFLPASLVQFAIRNPDFKFFPN
jgi:hypothetical protein